MFYRASQDFFFANLHAKWAQFVHVEELRRFVRAENADSLSRLLMERGVDTTRRTEVRRRLVLEFVRQLSWVSDRLPPRLGDFYRAFMERYFFEDFKTLLHLRGEQNPEASFAELMIAAPELPPLPVGALLAAKDMEAFGKSLPKHAAIGELQKIARDYESEGDASVMDAQVDAVFFQRLLAAAGKLPRSVRGRMLELVRYEIDVTNLEMCLRNASVYNLPAEKVVSLRIPGGELPAARLLGVAKAESTEEALSQLPSRFYKLLVQYVDEPLYRLENLFRNELYHQVRRLFRDFNRPLFSIVVFPWLKHFEAMNIGRVFEGLHFGLEPRQIEAILIGGDDRA